MDFAESSSYRELCREFHADENATNGVTREGAPSTYPSPPLSRRTVRFYVEVEVDQNVSESY